MLGGKHSMAEFQLAPHVKMAEPPQGDKFLQSQVSRELRTESSATIE
jgi:hypothetical protein